MTFQVMELYLYDFNDQHVSFKALKPTSESTLPDNEKKDSILGLYWTAQMATTYSSSTCSVK